jgi:hypothetical protein
MQTLPAKELKRRGLAALDKLLPLGPVQILRNNEPVAIAISPLEYERLKAAQKPARNVWDFIAEAGSTPYSTRTKEDIDLQLREERASWDRLDKGKQD